MSRACRTNQRRVLPVVPSCIALSFMLAAPDVAAAQTIVLRGATVITGTGSAPISAAVIVIEGDTIRAVGGAATPRPAGATVIDLSGKYIIPGLIESHAHYEEWMGELLLNYGVTTAMGIGGNLGDAKKATHRPGARSPRIYDTAGDPRINASMNEAQVRDGIRRWLELKPDFARLRDYTPESAQTYRWAADEIHKGGLLVFGHTNDAPQSVRDGHDVVEHMWGFIVPLMSRDEQAQFQSGRSLHWSLFLTDLPRFDQSMKDAISQGAFINPTLVYELGSLSRHALKHERELYTLYGDPSLAVYYPQNIAQSLLQKQRQIRNFNAKYENLVLLSRVTPEEREAFARGYQLAGQFLKRWVGLGGKIQAGTDTISGGTPGISLHHEMELLVEAGLTPMQALQSATTWSAEMLAGEQGARGRPKVGAIAPGMFADLVVLSADPLLDIANSKKLERVMKGGQFIALGYQPSYYTFTQPPRSIAMATPEPELSEIAPHTVVEGSSDFEVVVRGVGFVSNSVIRIDGLTVPTIFVSPRELKATVPAAAVKSATPNPFDAQGPAQGTGVFGDRTVKLTVWNAPPEGGLSNSISLRVRAKWMGVSERSGR